MKFLTTAVFVFGAFLLLIEMPDNIMARPTLHEAAESHEVWIECGLSCEITCDNHPGPEGCDAMCRRGYFCGGGYVREFPNGRCILPSECPARLETTTTTEIVGCVF